MTLKPLSTLLLALVLGVPATLAQDLPSLGDSSATVVSSLEEQRLGRQFMRNARRQMDFSTDPEVTDYVRRLGAELVTAIDLSPEEFTFSVVNDPNLNAFAVPGGFISLHSGLIAETESESELASVVAHEIAHVTQRHLPRMIARAKERSLPAAAAMVAAILVGGQMGSAALVGANAALAADQLRYSRDFEKEADSVGIRILAQSRFDPTAMPSFFQKLQRNSMLQSIDVPEYLRTHPLSVNRIADSESRASAYPATPHQSGYDYLMVRARVRALTFSDPARVAGYFADVSSNNPQEARAARYGEALAYMNAGQYANAATILDELTHAFPDDRYIALAAGQLALRAGRTEVAVERFEALYSRDPTDHVVAHHYAEALVASQRWEGARKVLRKWQRSDGRNPEVYRYLSRVDGELGRRAESFQARAEYFALRFESSRALEELDRARQYSTDNYYLTSSIDARSREIRDDMLRFKEDEPIR
jgi:beta-barrel assembly-enhancing protease